MKFLQYCAINGENGCEIIKFMLNNVYIFNVVVVVLKKLNACLL